MAWLDRLRGATEGCHKRYLISRVLRVWLVMWHRRCKILHLNCTLYPEVIIFGGVPGSTDIVHFHYITYTYTINSPNVILEVRFI